MRLIMTVALAAAAVASAPAHGVVAQSTDTTTGQACCLESTPSFFEPHTFLVNVTLRTALAKRNQNRLPAVVVFPDEYTVSGDLTLRPYGDVQCTRRSAIPAGTTGGNASRNWFDCASQYSEFFFAQFKVTVPPNANPTPSAPSARLFDSWCPPAAAYCPVPQQREDDSGMIVIGSAKVSTTTLIIVSCVVGVALGLAVFLFCRWKARRGHEKGIEEVEEARQRGEDYESQLKSRSAGIALPPGKGLLQRTKSGNQSDPDILSTVKLEELESALNAVSAAAQQAATTVQRSASKMALARSQSQYGSNSELHKALSMVPLHKQNTEYGAQERRATMGSWASSKKLPESTILVIKDAKPPTPTTPSSAEMVAAPTTDTLKRTVSSQEQSVVAAAPPAPTAPAKVAAPLREPVKSNLPISTTTARPITPARSAHQLPVVSLASSTAGTASPSSRPPIAKSSALNQPVSLGNKPAPGSPTLLPPAARVSSPQLLSGSELSDQTARSTLKRTQPRPAARSGNEYVLAYVPVSMVRGQTAGRKPAESSGDEPAQ